ncbi:MAG: hypothetical protein GXO27_04575 [Chlorobi bacterium]|nr:hypothetical protein [Chlorobiota bacterium]
METNGNFYFRDRVLRSRARMILKEFAASLKFGPVWREGDMMVLTLIGPAYEEPVYITSDRAMERGCLTVTEVSEAGSVPRLAALNQCGLHVFMAEGEELKGAKQNRTLNTSLLLPPHKRTVIPVSCTEEGRWQYRGRRFGRTDSWIPASLRHLKSRELSRRLLRKEGFYSDQMKIWDHIRRMEHMTPEMKSNTHALRDMIDARRARDQVRKEGFEPVRGQVGLAVFHRGRLLGADVITRPAVFGELFPKIMESYRLEIFLRTHGKVPGDIWELEGRRYNPRAARNMFKRLVELAVSGRLAAVKSPGDGIDIRMESTHAGGFALEYEGKIIHLSVYPTYEMY